MMQIAMGAIGILIFLAHLIGKAAGFEVPMILLGVAAILVFIFALWGIGKLYGILMSQNKSEVEIAESYRGSELAKSMFVKKYPEASIGDHKKIILAVGFIFTLGASIYALNYSNPPAAVEVFSADMPDFDEEPPPPPTEQVKPPPPPPPPPEIEVVEDDEILEEEPELETTEIEEEEIIEVPDVIEEEEVVEQEIFTVVEEMPRFPGSGCEGKATKAEKEQCAGIELQKYLAKVPYPSIAVENDIEGKVFVRFIIDEKGKIGNVEIARGADKLIDNAALNYVKTMPNWIPGKQRGKAVKVSYVVPFNFKLQ